MNRKIILRTDASHGVSPRSEISDSDSDDEDSQFLSKNVTNLTYLTSTSFYVLLQRRKNQGVQKN